MLFDLLQPAPQVLKGLVPCDIVREEDAVGTTIENSSHRLERLLSSGIPDLELDDFVVNLEAIGAEFDTDSDLMLLLELIVHDAFHEAGFTHACVTNDNQLE